MLKIGDKAPHFKLSTVKGELVSLEQEIQENRNVLLIFLRHLG